MLPFFVAASILTQLGYFLHLGKCVPVPMQRLIFLGHLVDTTRQTISIPEEKKAKFIALREGILSSKSVSLNQLQRFRGKCTSLTLMVPAAQLYTPVVAHAISRCQKQGTPIHLDGELREEILHWLFLDTWTGFVPWRTEEHTVLRTIASDASQSCWGATLSLQNGIVLVDYFGQDIDETDIAMKEAHALLCALQAFSSRLTDTLVDAMVDNQILNHAWLHEGGKNQSVNKVLKSIFEVTLRQNIALSLQWVPSALNPADQPSRAWSDCDVMVSRQLWEQIETFAGPHTIDLVALDSNAQCSRHYTPFPTPCSTGSNFFAQNPCHTPQGDDENGYLFPPAFLIGPALQHSRATGATVTLLVYDVFPRPYWWPILCHSSCARLLLAKAGDPTALIWPSRTHGFSKPKNMPLPWDLVAFRINGIQLN